MSEYEIFSSDEEYEPELPSRKKQQKEKRVKVKTESSSSNFFKEVFSLNYLSITLSVFSVLFTMLMGFIPLVSATRATYQAVGAFFFLGFGFALAGLVLEAVKMAINKKVQFNVNLVFVITALVLSAVVLFI